MNQAMSRLLHSTVFVLVILSYTRSQQDTESFVCYTDHAHDYFLYTTEVNWFDAEQACKDNNRTMSVSRDLILNCTSNLLNKSVLDKNTKVAVWMEKIDGHPTKCKFLVYENDEFSNKTNKNCGKKRNFVCFSKTTEKTSTGFVTSSTVTNVPQTTIFETTTEQYTIIRETVTTTTVTQEAVTTINRSLTTSDTQTLETETQSAKISTENDAPLTGGVISGIAVGIVTCVVVILAIYFFIRRRNQRSGSPSKKQKHSAFIITYGLHSPDVISSAPGKDCRGDGAYFEVEPHTRFKDPPHENSLYYNIQEEGEENVCKNDNRLQKELHAKDNSKAMSETATGEYAELSIYQNNTSANYEYATSVDGLSTISQPQTLRAISETTDNDTYDHINKQASPNHLDEDNVYSHTDNDTNDEYAHTTFTREKEDKQMLLDVDNVYSHTGPELNVEYSDTNFEARTGQNNSEEDDTYNHTNGQPSAV